MRNLQAITDKLAISLSLLCTIHCLALPIVVVLLPSFAAMVFEDEAFHVWMVVAVIPTSVIALTMGCKQHQLYSVLLIGVIGLGVLGAAAFLGEERLDETGEKAVTLLGAALIALGHAWNYYLCRRKESCECL